MLYVSAGLAKNWNQSLHRKRYSSNKQQDKSNKISSRTLSHEKSHKVSNISW